MRRAWGRDLIEPLPLLAVAVLALNDHVLKPLFPGVVTGKLSDVAGLFFFPVLLVTVARLACVVLDREEPRALAAIAASITAVAFFAVKALAPVNELANRLWGRVVLDRSDLLALPVTALAAWYLHRRRDREAAPRPFKQAAATLFAAAASIATPAVHKPPCRAPVAQPKLLEWSSVCARTPGLRVVLHPTRADVALPLQAAGPPCTVAFAALTLDYDAGPFARARVMTRPAPIAVQQEALLEATLDLPFAASCDRLVAWATREGSAYDDDPMHPPPRLPIPVASCTVAP